MANKIKINGVEYPSCAAAARAFGVTRSAIQHRLDKGTLEGLVTGNASVEPVTIRGVTYPSHQAAADALGVSQSGISKAKARGNLEGVGDGKRNNKPKGGK